MNKLIALALTLFTINYVNYWSGYAAKPNSHSVTPAKVPGLCQDLAAFKFTEN